MLAVMMQAGNILALLGALALIISGAALIVQSNRLARDRLTRRIDLVRPADMDDRNPSPAADEASMAQLALPLEERDLRQVMRFMARFGVPARRAANAFLMLRLFGAVVLAIVAFGVASLLSLPVVGEAVIVACIASGGWFGPMALVHSALKQRAAAVAAGLPEALELLVVCVEAGLALEEAIDRVVVELRHSQPALAEELSLTAADLKILSSRDDALLRLAKRVDLPSVRSVVATLCQTMRFGTPLAQALRVVAADLRGDSLLLLEKRANELPVMLTLPMMLFIMPTIFLIVGGPAALRLIDNFLH
jgi:tight adherence protein C